MLRILDTAITLTFHTIIAVAAVLVAFFWIIDTIKRYYHWLRGKRYRSMFVPPPRKRKRLVDANRLSPPQASRLAWPSAHRAQKLRMWSHAASFRAQGPRAKATILPEKCVRSQPVRKLS